MKGRVSPFFLLLCCLCLCLCCLCLCLCFFLFLVSSSIDSAVGLYQMDAALGIKPIDTFQGIDKTSASYRMLATMGWREGEGLVGSRATVFTDSRNQLVGTGC